MPGTFILVDHSIFRAFNKGALGMLRVDGTGGSRGLLRQADPTWSTSPRAARFRRSASSAPVTHACREQGRAHRARSADVHERLCRVPPAERVRASRAPSRRSPGPTILNSDKRRRAISTIVRGLTGPVVVNGKTFNSVMPALGLSDEEVANVLTYVYNQWNNAGHEVTAAEVRSARGASGE